MRTPCTRESYSSRRLIRYQESTKNIFNRKVGYYVPNGRAHTIACLATAAVSGCAIYFGNLASLTTSCNVAEGALIGILISPDLDIENGNISNYYLRKISPPLAWLWRWLWWPYGKLFRHRGISHWPIIGTGSRILYIVTWIMLITIILIMFGIRVPMQYDWAVTRILGLAIADIVHATMDAIF